MGRLLPFSPSSYKRITDTARSARPGSCDISLPACDVVEHQILSAHCRTSPSRIQPCRTNHTDPYKVLHATASLATRGKTTLGGYIYWRLQSSCDWFENSKQGDLICVGRGSSGSLRNGAVAKELSSRDESREKSLPTSQNKNQIWEINGNFCFEHKLSNIINVC